MFYGVKWRWGISVHPVHPVTFAFLSPLRRPFSHPAVEISRVPYSSTLSAFFIFILALLLTPCLRNPTPLSDRCPFARLWTFWKSRKSAWRSNGVYAELLWSMALLRKLCAML